MDIEFADERLTLIETERAAETGLPVAVIQASRHRLNVIRAAPDVRTLRNWKSLGLQSRPEMADHLLMLPPKWAMAVSFVEKNGDMVVIVKAMEQQLWGAVA